MKEKATQAEADGKIREFYINRILPVREMFMTCSLMHKTVQNKEEFNMLLIHEQNNY